MQQRNHQQFGSIFIAVKHINDTRLEAIGPPKNGTRDRLIIICPCVVVKQLVKLGIRLISVMSVVTRCIRATIIRSAQILINGLDGGCMRRRT